MSSGNPAPLASSTNSARTRDRLKAAAQILFARHGVDGVTVQQIVTAAGQRNNASLHYHFGSKEELIRQLIVEGAKELDERRKALLDSHERSGAPFTARDLLRIMVLPVFDLTQEERWQGYVQFTSSLQTSNREMFRSALNNRWNSAYVRCFDHLKKLLQHIPAPVLEQRLSLFIIYGNAITSVRDFELTTRRQQQNRFWNKPFTIENILDTLEASVTCPPSAATLDQLKQA